MNAYATYNIKDMTIIVSSITDLHAKIEVLLEKASVFMAKYEYNVPTPWRAQELQDGLYSLIADKSKYTISQIVNFNNDLTKFIISFANIIKFSDSQQPTSISIDITLLEYIFFLKIHTL